MSTVKTTLKVESTTLFPNPVAVNSVTNTTDISDSNLGKITINHETPSYLVTGEVGAKGTFLYVKSASTNGSEVTINIYGEDSETPIVTIYSGDSGCIPITGIQGKLYAKTTYGTASLEYFTGSRGEDLGQFTLVYQLDGTPGDNLMYFVIDANSGVASKLYDTGFAKADYAWDSYETGVQNGGIVFRLNALGPVDDELFLTDKVGAPLLGHGLTVNWTNNFWNLEGKGVIFTYDNGTSWRLSYYNGNEVYHHDFVGASSVIPETNWDNCSANGTVAAYISTHNGIAGQEAIYLIKDDQKSLITDINNSTDIYADASTYSFSNYFVVTLFDDDISYYTGIKIFDTSGSLLKSVVLPANTYNSFNYEFYGTGHWQTYLFDSSNTAVSYLLFNYNQSTGFLIGEDLDWTHVKGTNYPSVSVSSNSYSPTGVDSAKHESLAVCFYDEDTYDVDLITKYNLNYLDIHYVIGNSTTANKEVIHSTPGTDYWVNLNLQTNDTSIQMLTAGSDYEGGPLNVLNFTTTGHTTITLVSDLTTYTSGNSWAFYSTGDYRLFQYSINATDKTVYKVLSNTAVLDTLIIDNAGETNYRTQQNSIFIRTWGLAGPQKNWYFNTNTKKFVQLPKFYSQRGYANITATNGLEPNYMVLVSPEYWRTDNQTAARMLINGVVTNEVVLVPNATTVIDNNWDYVLTPQGLTFSYQDSTDSSKWVIKGYNFDLVNKYNIVTVWSDKTWNADYQNVNMMALRPANNSTEYHIFNFGSLVNYKEYYNGSNPQYVINDWNYIN